MNDLGHLDLFTPAWRLVFQSLTKERSSAGAFLPCAKSFNLEDSLYSWEGTDLMARNSFISSHFIHYVT